MESGKNDDQLQFSWVCMFGVDFVTTGEGGGGLSPLKMIIAKKNHGVSRVFLRDERLLRLGVR